MNEIEIEFLSILMNHPELLKATAVKKNYFENRNLAKIYEILNKVGKFDPTAFIENNFNDMEFLLMIYQSFMFENAYMSVFKYDELKIINNHKTKLLDELNLKLSRRDITYEGYRKAFEQIDEIKPIGSKEHLDLKEIIDVIREKENPVSLGRFKRIGKVLLLQEDDLVTVAAPPGFGKSAFLMNVFNEFLNDDEAYCQYYNLEINAKQFIKRMIAIEAKEKISDVSKFSDNHLESIEKAVNRLGNKKYYLYNDSIFFEKLEAEIISHLKRGKKNVIFIDYLGLIGLENKNHNKTSYDRVTYIMKELRKICITYKVLVFICSQCDRASLKNERLTLFSLKDSGEVENSSTHVCLLYENKDRKADFATVKNVMMDVAKNRNNYTYKLELQFVGNKMLFTESPKNRLGE